MVQYRIKGTGDMFSYVEVVEEKSSGYEVLITREYENCLKQSAEFVNRELFESCLRTGYLIPIKTPVRQQTA